MSMRTGFNGPVPKLFSLFSSQRISLLRRGSLLLRAVADPTCAIEEEGLTMRFTIDEIGAARLFLLARGRVGENEAEDHAALTQLLRTFASQGVKVGLERSKEIFRKSWDSAGACQIISKGDDCRCFLCLVEREIER